LAYELRRLGNLSLNINYTLSFTEGTGSSATSGSAELQQFIASGLPNLRTQFPVTFDSRHNINAQIDYRFAGDRRGPTIGKSHPFENAGIQVIFTARSGEPYTKYANPQGLTGISNSPVIEGTVNGSRLSGHYNVDVNLDKTIPLNFHKIKEGEAVRRPSRLGLNIYAYAKNLLNIKDVRGVYGYSGRADEDAFLTSAQGAAVLINQQDPASFTNYYNMAVRNPGLVGPPRTVIVGLRLNF
jgi:hypothetical protein